MTSIYTLNQQQLMVLSSLPFDDIYSSMILALLGLTAMIYCKINRFAAHSIIQGLMNIYQKNNTYRDVDMFI